MDQWEYKREVVLDRNLDLALPVWGKDGWELVFVRHITSPSNSYEVIFKRPRKPEGIDVAAMGSAVPFRR